MLFWFWSDIRGYITWQDFISPEPLAVFAFVPNECKQEKGSSLLKTLFFLLLISSIGEAVFVLNTNENIYIYHYFFW
jgi:hypothetical protein